MEHFLPSITMHYALTVNVIMEFALEVFVSARQDGSEIDVINHGCR